MARDDYEEEGNGRGSKRGSSSRGGRSSSDTFRAATAGLSTAAVIDIVERLGLVDLVVDRVKQRLEDVDVDDLVEEVGDYLKRNPEVLVVSLGAVTIAAGALVYLNRRKDTPRRESKTPTQSRPTPASSAAKRRATT
jgi:hypothetical protein